MASSSFFRRLFKGVLPEEEPAVRESFAARFLRFKLFLGSYAEAYSEMMSFEERLAEEPPIGMPFLRMCTARLTAATMQCVLQLNALGSGRFERLNDPFSRLRGEVQEILARGALDCDGPLTVPYHSLGEEHLGLVSPSLYKLSAIKAEHPEFLPPGFVITGAAWRQYFNDPDIHDEIDRIMVISQDDPASYSEAGATIRERLNTSFPLPQPLEDAVRRVLEQEFSSLDKPGQILLLRAMPVQLEHSALVMPEQVLRTPLTADDVLRAVRSSLIMTYRPRAMIYRLKRGIRTRALPLCISATLVPDEHGRGSAHRDLAAADSGALCLHIRRGLSAPENWPSQAAVEGATLPDVLMSTVRKNVRTALDCLADAPVRGNRHEIYWVAAADGRFFVHGVNALPDPEPGDATTTATGPDTALLSLEGGLGTYPGVVTGPAHLVRNFTDALSFPLGGILVLPQASTRWSFLLDFAAGAIAGNGTGNGLFARTARRYGRPTILCQPSAFERLETGQPLRLTAVPGRAPVVEVLGEAPEQHVGVNAQVPLRGAAWPQHLPYSSPPTWLPSSDIAEMARALAPKLAASTLPDSDSVDFRAENCKTFLDILGYCHVHAVREMYYSGVNAKTKDAPAKQLVCDVPKQFWIVNLDDGFSEEVKGPVVHLEQIASVPMRSLWEGFTAKPWDGPPQLNARGFLSVLFEATANPNLDPASQSSQYAEKNIFLIARRFCSMRCRFGFHFLSMDCLLGEREKERFIIFQFKGGAANLGRRIRRVHFVAELLAQFEFFTEISGDTLTARLEEGSEEQFISALRVLGYLVMHTRQLDMIMGDESALAAHRFTMLEDMLSLAAPQI